MLRKLKKKIFKNQDGKDKVVIKEITPERPEQSGGVSKPRPVVTPDSEKKQADKPGSAPRNNQRNKPARKRSDSPNQPQNKPKQDENAPRQSQDKPSGDSGKGESKPKGNAPQRKKPSPRKPSRERTRTAPPKSKEVKIAKPVEKKDFGPWDPSEFVVEPKEGETRFHDLNLPVPLLRAIADIGFKYCTPIQAEILPEAFKGNDVTGKAQTGTGKTAAFLLTAMKHILENPIEGKRRKGTPRVLVMAPTRELVMQIEKDAVNLGKYTDIETLSVFGGMGYEKQKRTLAEKNVDIVIATPGRLLDFKHNKNVFLGSLDMVIIDEADRMLDMGFIPDIRKIMNSTPPKEERQTMLFSATLNQQVTELASRWTKNQFKVEIEPENVTSEQIEQRAYVISSDEKFKLLYNMITQQDLKSLIVFTNRRDQTRKLSEKLTRYNISCNMLSGDVSQSKRIKTLESFRSGETRVLVATDVAARGIHVDGVSHVFNYNLPDDADSYVHRIGRTGRAGAKGVSVIFACEEESLLIPQIEEHTGVKLNYIYPEGELMQDLPEPTGPKPERQPRGGRPGGSNNRRRKPDGRRSGSRQSGRSGGKPGGNKPKA
ncbi:DEAD/DEAH box helicase [Limisalsivibrio acetivorans]|uniref:DEAD/DEAH box helicase n=1 Tax=Limisalsivibrio acetivorans TaxID=1304888 RepID=UPI0003B6D831|nr:DEAD/DEAH box helicase [Limisalsivibrio acetivorans]